MDEILIKTNNEETRKNALEYFKNNELSVDVWMKKYALKDNDIFIEKSPQDTINRIINELESVEKKYKNPYTREQIEFFLKDFKYFIPAGSILFGAGNTYTKSSLGNCFFIDNESDSYGGIFDLDQSMVQLMKRRGGVGITLEHLRPEGVKVNNAAASSTGAISFMERFSNSTREVAQDGRRGALMISCDVAHPNIKEFITKKDNRTSVTGANISVKISDEFMKAVLNNEDYILRWPTTAKIECSNEKYIYDKLYKLSNNVYIKRVKAKEIWDLLIKMAHKNAEPGVLFWDTVLEESPADCYSQDGFRSNGVNPCITGDMIIATDKGDITMLDLLDKFNSGEIVNILSYNENTKKLEYLPLYNASKTKDLANVIELELDNGEFVKLTPDHKVYTENRGWVEAAKLETTDILLSIW